MSVYVGQMMIGYSMGWSAPVVPKLQDPEQTPLPEAIGDAEASLAGTLLYIGAILGPYVCGYLSNAKGRKACLLLGGVIIFCSNCMLALAKSIVVIYIGRTLIGVGVSMTSIIHIIYIGEIATTNIRGVLHTSTAIFSTIGTLLVYSVGPYVTYAWTSWLGAAVTLVYVIGLFFVPETPLFLILIGKEKEAVETLVALGRPEDIDEILQTKSNKTATLENWLQIFTINTNRRTLFITMPLTILQQMSGIGAVMFFATSIFEFAGSSVEPNIATIIIGVTQIVSSTVTPFFVERAGRKTLLLISTAGACSSLVVLGIFFWLDEIGHEGIDKIKWLPLVSLISFFLTYNVGLAIIPWTLVGEMFTSNVRGTGSVVVGSFASLVGFGVSTAFSYMISGLGGAITFWIFSGSCATAFLFTIIFVPETKGKSLMEILEMLSK